MKNISLFLFRVGLFNLVEIESFAILVSLIFEQTLFYLIAHDVIRGFANSILNL